ncbi:hypothetical protein [Rhodococcus sp. 24CO]|uniref:hypothetical protein n=1 Tax=Rhodococcus sp. 24CO TaxID=3117460 RepID=UPI003D3421C3
MRSSRLATVAAAGAMIVLLSGSAGAQSNTPVPEAGVFEPLCTPTDPGLEELSGLVAVGNRIYAVGDSGNDDVVLELDTDCVVRKRIPVPIEPYDVEDLASYDGSLILADIGDNLRTRETIAFITLDLASGSASLHRATYPDGPHDAEAVLVDRSGRVFVVTKELFGTSSIYTPAQGQSLSALAEPGPTPLTRVGTLSTGDGTAASMFTGGAVSTDGSVVALRNYSDVYLYTVGDEGIGAALTEGQPLRISTPYQPQGESVTFTAAGDLVIGSESKGGALPPLYVMRGAVEKALASQNSESYVADISAGESREESSNAAVWGIGGAVVALAIGGGVLVRVRKRR